MGSWYLDVFPSVCVCVRVRARARLSSLCADPNRALCLALLSRGSECQGGSQLCSTSCLLILSFLLPPQQGVFGAHSSNAAMSIIGAEDEDFENDLMNDVSVNQWMQ